LGFPATDGDREVAMPRDPLRPRQCARLLAALAAPERLGIIRILAGGPHTVTAIAEGLAILPVNLSHHLGVLKLAGLVRGRKEGRFIHYSLRPGVLEVLSGALDLGCCRLVFTAGALGRAHPASSA
jgi:DNA-binding transcriptional ArsR family regulator